MDLRDRATDHRSGRIIYGRPYLLAQTAYAGVRLILLPDDSDLIPELILRRRVPESKTPLSHWNSGVIFGCGDRI